jgi:hypothetical protein
MVPVELQAGLGDSEMNKTWLITPQSIPGHQQVESRHGEGHKSAI